MAEERISTFLRWRVADDVGEREAVRVPCVQHGPHGCGATIWIVPAADDGCTTWWRVNLYVNDVGQVTSVDMLDRTRVLTPGR